MGSGKGNPEHWVAVYHELVESGEFDIVVVDTPPTRNALDLLDAPRRLTRFLENRLFRALLFPTRMSLRAVGMATQALLRERHCLRRAFAQLEAPREPGEEAKVLELLDAV